MEQIYVKNVYEKWRQNDAKSTKIGPPNGSRKRDNVRKNKIPKTMRKKARPPGHALRVGGLFVRRF